VHAGGRKTKGGASSAPTNRLVHSNRPMNVGGREMKGGASSAPTNRLVHSNRLVHAGGRETKGGASSASTNRVVHSNRLMNVGDRADAGRSKLRPYRPPGAPNRQVRGGGAEMEAQQAPPLRPSKIDEARAECCATPLRTKIEHPISRLKPDTTTANKSD
jgi:hypothetical protein